MAKDKTDRAREEFLSEAQELIEAMSRDLLLIDQGIKQGKSDPDTLNDLFRSVHTLKGLAGMFGLTNFGQLAHSLEDLLEDLRLGRVALSQNALDLLFEGIDNFQRYLAEAKNPGERAEVDLRRFIGSLAGLSNAAPPPTNIIDEFEIESSVLGVLTEYEEHRLRTNLEQGLTIYRLRIRLSLDVIDTALEELKARAKTVAEIITYLPSMDGGGGDTIDIEVLMASNESEAELRSVLARPEAALQVIERRRGKAKSPTPQARSKSIAAAAETSAGTYMAESPGEALVGRDLGGDQLSLRSVSKTVRVDIGKLDYLMNLVGELAVVRGTVARLTDALRGDTQQRKLYTELQRANRSFERHLADMQAGVLDVRMVPLGQVFDKLARIIRQVARDRDKDVRLVVTGMETEVDKLIAEELADPLMHIVRNAVDHGVESAQERQDAGKPAVGTIAISAYQKGNHVVIDVQDDGGGIDPGAILERAVAMNLLREDQVGELGREEILNVLFLPGFSTAKEVTDTSGRGVGMDVVKTNITRLGGVIDVSSELGVGTKFTITLPITLAIISALIVEVAGRALALPLAAVQEALRLDPAEIRRVDGREMLTLRGSTLPICRLGDLLGFQPPPGHRVTRQFVVVVVLGQRRLGFVVDALGGQEDVVIKNLGASLSNIRGVAGATDRGDQKLVLVLDASGLLDEVLAGADVLRLAEAAS